MKLVRILTIAAIVSAFATASFAGSCCSKKKDCTDKEKAKTEKKEEPKKNEQPK